jgi:pyruvate/2-oxoglutarate/acetoin dehydrogenase E1 component
MKSQITYLASLNKSLNNLLASNGNLQVIGEDLIDPYGGAFKVTKGLSLIYPNQIHNMPISEAAIVGFAGGIGLSGGACIAEIMFGDFILLAADQIINQVTKIPLMYNKTIPMNVLIRAPMGGYRGYGPTHSQSLETLFLNIPGLTILSPNLFTSPGELLEKGMLLNSPVLFIEHKCSYPIPLIESPYSGMDLSIEICYDSLGFEVVKISCDGFDESPEVIIFSYGYVSKLCLDALVKVFLDEEINVALIVISNINHCQPDVIKSFLSKSRKLLFVEEASSVAGWGRFYASHLIEGLQTHGKLYSLKFLGAKSGPIPSKVYAEEEMLPSVKSIISVIKELADVRR